MAVNEVDPLGLRPKIEGAARDKAIEMGMALPSPEVPEPWSFRHPSVRHFYPLFESAHLPPDLQDISVLFERLALNLLTMCHDGPELSTALRRLVEAKDCVVRQRVIDKRSAR